LDKDAVETIRRELRWHPVLGWLRPPPSRDVRSQLFTAALWYRALMAPEGAAWGVRYGEQLGLAAALGLLGLVPFGWFQASSANLGQSRVVDCLAILSLCFPLGWLGWQQLIVTARRQAILDYFAAHLSQ
jgi:hypothetical protein